MSRLVCNDASHIAIGFLEKNLEMFQPVEKVTSFFDSRNFLITKYNLSHSSINTVIENRYGDLMEFSGLNCGYGGAGPQATAHLLRMLGIEESESYRLMQFDGLQIEFKKTVGASDYSVSTEAFFNNRVRQKTYCGCNLNKYTIADVIARDVYMINPESYNFVGLLNCLQVMQPREFEYILGKQNFLIASRDVLKLGPWSETAFPWGTEGVNLIIRGKRFDLKCFIDNTVLKGTLNAIYLYLVKRSLFTEYSLGRSTALYPSQPNSYFATLKILVDIFRKEKAPIHQILKVSDKELKKRDF